MQRGKLDRSLYVVSDDVNGHHRLSYMKLRDRTILALVQFVNIDPLDGIPYFQTGYAVPENFRHQGFGKVAFKAALDEMALGIGRFGDFYVEAIVGVENLVSQKISESVLGGPPQEIQDSLSGKPALRYLRRISARSSPP